MDGALGYNISNVPWGNAPWASVEGIAMDAIIGVFVLVWVWIVIASWPDGLA